MLTYPFVAAVVSETHTSARSEPQVFDCVVYPAGHGGIGGMELNCAVIVPVPLIVAVVEELEEEIQSTLNLSKTAHVATCGVSGPV
jgi:hypothetical protein